MYKQTVLKYNIQVNVLQRRGAKHRMRQFFKNSRRGDLKEATKGLANPHFIMLFSNQQQFESHVRELQQLYPQVPSIGCIGMSYDSENIEDKGVGIIAFYDDIQVSTNVLEEASKMPVKYIQRLQEDIKKVNANQIDTVCIDFCSGNDACVLTTIYTVLKPLGISLMGGTGDAGKVSANGKIYQDAVAYALIKNKKGKIKTYKENIYRKMKDYRFVASKTDKSKYIIGALNGRPAKKVYQDILHVTEKEILTQTFKNPFGKLNGDETYIVSIKDVQGDALACFRQVNDSDVLALLELRDYREITKETIEKIKKDFKKPSVIFSVNCLFRYKLFHQGNYMKQYLKEMGTLGIYTGFVGYGEHYNNQFVNQSMSCVVFE